MFTVCYPLHIYLNVLGVNNSVAGGWYKVSEKSQPSHFWLSLSNYADYIVDPTIQQFEPDSSMVYVGPKPDTHLPQPLFPLNECIKIWQRNLIEENSRIDIAHYLPVNLRAAEEVLQVLAFNRMSIDNINSYTSYFDCILAIVHKHNSQFNITAHQYPRLFNQLKL